MTTDQIIEIMNQMWREGKILRRTGVANWYYCSFDPDSEHEPYMGWDLDTCDRDISGMQPRFKTDNARLFKDALARMLPHTDPDDIELQISIAKLKGWI